MTKGIFHYKVPKYIAKRYSNVYYGMVFCWLKKESRSLLLYKYIKLRAIWYNLYNLNNVRSTHGGVLLLVKLQSGASNSS